MIDTVKSALQGLLSSVVRTVVPIVASFVVAILVQINVPVDEEFNGTIVTFVSSLLGALSGALYYLIVRILEKTTPWASWLLGSKNAPVAYAPASAVADHSVVAVTSDKVTG
jgi:flagellar biosynthesis protein FliR